MFGQSGRFETRDIPARTYEKTGMQIELGEQITDIRRALAELSRKKKQLTRRDLHEKWEEIDDLVLNLLSRTVTLAEPRGVPIRSIMRDPPELVRDEDGMVLYADWYDYTLRWMALILRMLDEAQLLLTEEGPMPDWATPLFGEARGQAFEGVDEAEDLERNEEEDEAKQSVSLVAPVKKKVKRKKREGR